MTHNGRKYIAGITLHEAMFLTLCAVLLVTTKVFFRLKLGIPGHNTVFLAFCLILGRTLVVRPLAASFVGLVAGLAMMALGLGKAGPLVLVQTIVPGLLIDALALIGLTRSIWGAVLLGLVTGLGRAPAQLLANLLVGMELDIALLSTGLKSLTAIAFGGIGGLAAFVVAKRLIRAGLAPDRT